MARQTKRIGEVSMTVNEYQQLARKTLNPSLQEKDILMGGVMGLCGEAGECIDIVKKHLAQGHPLDREHLARELGDESLVPGGDRRGHRLRPGDDPSDEHRKAAVPLPGGLF